MEELARSEDGRHLSIVIATTNRGKMTEFRALLAGLPVHMLTLDEALPNGSAIEPLAGSFEQNAIHKAQQVAEASKLITLADDSGLEIDALGGRPGVRSIRFAKEGATDAENNAALLAELDAVDDGERMARFRCALALSDPWAESPEPIVTEGRCEGSIARQTSGAGGFGYDSIFIIDGEDRTMAELSEEEKVEKTHRARAVAAMRPHLERIVAERLRTAVEILGKASP